MASPSESFSSAGCLDEQAALDFIAGKLSPGDTAAAHAHLDGCEPCRRYVALLSDSEGVSRGETVLTRSDRPVARPPPSSTGELAPGQRVAHYVVERALGEGGMSLVYAAVDTELARPVALKILRPELAKEPNVRARLLREAQAMARLSHPNVLTVYEAKDAGGVLYVSMEYVEGTTLQKWLLPPRPLRDVLRAFLDAGKGLAAAHASGVVHRDFKPENVLIGTDGRVRVMDFGLARAQVEDASALGARITQTGMFLGTPAYASPEQMQGQPAGPRADQFCFCVALFEAVFGKRPFDGSSFSEVAQAMRRITFDGQGGGRRVPSWLRRVLQRGLQWKPEQRYPSMEALLEVLVKGQGELKGRVILGAAAAGLLALLGGGFAWTRATAHPPTAPAPAGASAVPPPPIAAPVPIPTPPPLAVSPSPAETPKHPAPKHRDVAAATVPPPVLGHGWVKLVPTGMGFADVFVDDEPTPRGRVPRQEPLELPAGTHRIHLERAGQLLDEQRVTVLADQTLRLTLRLEAAMTR